MRSDLTRISANEISAEDKRVLARCRRLLEAIVERQETIPSDRQIIDCQPPCSCGEHERVDVNYLADKLFVSRKTLERSLEGCGFTPAQLIREVLLDHAYKLLTTTHMSVAEVRKAAGYKDPDHFARIFKDRFGFTPQASRRLDKPERKK